MRPQLGKGYVNADVFPIMENIERFTPNAIIPDNVTMACFNTIMYTVNVNE